MAQFKGRTYKPLEKRQTIQDIRNLLIEGFTYDAIMEELHIERRTFYRYLNLVFEDDRRLLAENISDEETLNQMAICRDRLLSQRRQLLDMARDSDLDGQVRINAHHLAAEIAAAVLKFYTDGPGMLAARHQFPRTSLTAQGTRGVSLKLSKPLGYNDDDRDNGKDDGEEQEEQVDDIEVVDEFNDDGEIEEEATREEKDSKALTWEHKTSNEKFR